MPYPDKLYRFNITGTVPGGDQQVHTVWMRADPATATAGVLQGLTDRVRDKWAETINGGTGLPLGLATKLAAETVYTSVSGYSVDAFGRATTQAEALFAAGVKGTATSAVPPQVALVVTLLTARPGRSGRGRLFLGGFAGSNVLTSGRYAPAARDAVADAMAGFYTRLRDLQGTADLFRPVVVSPTLGDSFKISKIAVGDVFDTMRSRRNALVEAKVSRVVDAT